MPKDRAGASELFSCPDLQPPCQVASGVMTCRLAVLSSLCYERLAQVLLCVPGTSSKPRPVRGNFQPEQ